MDLEDVVDGKYRMVRLVGHGAMASVYEAEHLELGQRFALKTTRVGLELDGATRARFLREARSAARVAHPNVIRVVDFGSLDDGRPYLIMEYVEGASLGQVLAVEGRASASCAIARLRQLAAAVDAIHGCGLLHRDIKPDNVVVSRDGAEAETLRVVDFGLVLSVGERRITGPGVTVGTVAYMSPEACRGNEVDRGTDIYAVGAMAFELLAGRLPFDDDEELLSMLMAKIDHEAPSITDFAPEHADLAAVFERVLSRDPDRRPRTAGAFVDELERIIARRATGATRPPRARLALATVGRTSRRDSGE